MEHEFLLSPCLLKRVGKIYRAVDHGGRSFVNTIQPTFYFIIMLQQVFYFVAFSAF